MIVVVMELLVLMNRHEALAALHSRTMIFFKWSFSRTLWSNHIVNVMTWNKLLHGIMVMLMVLVVVVIKHITDTHIIEWHRGLLV